MIARPLEDCITAAIHDMPQMVRRAYREVTAARDEDLLLWLTEQWQEHLRRYAWETRQGMLDKQQHRGSMP